MKLRLEDIECDDDYDDNDDDDNANDGKGKNTIITILNELVNFKLNINEKFIESFSELPCRQKMFRFGKQDLRNNFPNFEKN